MAVGASGATAARRLAGPWGHKPALARLRFRPTEGFSALTLSIQIMTAEILPRPVARRRVLQAPFPLPPALFQPTLPPALLMSHGIPITSPPGPQKLPEIIRMAHMFPPYFPLPISPIPSITGGALTIFIIILMALRLR